MSENIELLLLKQISILEKKVNKLEGKNQDGIPTYSFSKMTYEKLEECVNIEFKYDKKIFDNWFNYDYQLSNEDIDFLSQLLNNFGDIITRLKEESLKVLFISQILNRINFFSMKYQYNGLYDEPLTYKTDKFIFNGEADFIFAKGLTKSEKPYFFLQEFKQEKGSGEPEYQLLAELISAVELNDEIQMKGVYIKGAIWRFVILEKIKKHKYQYFVSQNFDSTKINDLKDIYKNLLFIKNEIIEIVKKENEKDE